MPNKKLIPTKAQVAGSTVYVLNQNNTNRWSFQVQPGFDDKGKRLSQEDLNDKAIEIAACYNKRMY